jgi:hypothetical protein
VTQPERCGDVDRHIHDSCFRIAEKAGALRFCARGHAALYRPFDDRAEARAFSEIAAAQSGGSLAGHGLATVFAALCRILDEADRRCPACAGQA